MKEREKLGLNGLLNDFRPWCVLSIHVCACEEEKCTKVRRERTHPFVPGGGAEDLTFLGQKYSHCKSAFVSAEFVHVGLVHQFPSTFPHTCAYRGG